MIDDSALIHGRPYDPRKAHEYYLRTRKLKGRHPGGGEQPGNRSSGGSSQGGGGSGGGTSNSVLRPSQREHLLAEKKKLENRLDYLKQLLEEAVNAAKKRSGVKTSPKDTKSSTTEKKASKKDGKPDKPLTAAEKAKKRKDSKERYQKEKQTSLSQDVETLHRQIKDIRAKLEAAYKDARQQHAQSTQKTASNGR